MRAEAFIAHAVERCRRVSAGAAELMPLFEAVMPFSGDDLDELELVQVAGATAFLKRFEQLQDLIGRAVRAIAGWEGQDAAALSHRDVANWLEKRAVVGVAAEWMVAVRLRNRLVHEYPIEEEEQVRRPNECWSLMPLLRTATERLDVYIQDQGLKP